MKKILSILLAVCLLLTMFTLPALAEVVEDGTIEYRKFDFSVDQYNYRNRRDSQYSGSRTYSSIVTGLNGTTDGPTAGEAVKVDYVEYGGKTVMRIRMNTTATNGSDARTVVVPHYKAEDGTYMPIKLTAGKTYNIKYNIIPVRLAQESNNRIFTEMYINTAATGFRNASGGSSGYGKWSSAAMYDGHKLATIGMASNHSNYVPVAGLYVPFTRQKTGEGYEINVAGAGMTTVPVVSITDGAVGSSSKVYGAAGAKTYTVDLKNVGMLPATDPDEDTDGDFDDLGDWQVEWNPNAAGTGKGAYVYKMYGGNTYHYTDHLGLSLPQSGTANVYFDVTDYTAAQLADLPFQDQIVEVGDKKYARAYNEFLVTDLEYSEAGKAAVICKDGDNVKTFVGNVGEVVNLPTPAAQEGKAFLGWFQGDTWIGNANSTFTLKEGTPWELTAKWATDEVTIADDITIMGKDIQINGTNYVNGTAVSSYAGGDYLKVTDKALVLTSPNVKTGTFTSTTKADYIMFANRGNDKDYTIVGADGKPIVAEPNTEYIINISYKQTKPGRIGLRIGAGRSTSKATATTANTGSLGQNSAIAASNTYINNGNRGNYYINFGATGFPATYNQDSNAKELTAGTVDTTVQTYSFGIKTGSLEGMIPEFNMISVDFGTMGRYVSSEGTTHTYECVGVPEVEIYSIQILKVGSNENVVAFNGSSNNVGSSLVYKAGVAGSDVEAPANFENRWYVGNAGTTTIFDGMVPAAKLTNLYDYNSVLDNVGISKRAYIGCRGIFINEFEKDGETIQALQYKPYTYDEYYEKYGVGLQSSAAEEKTDAEKLDIMKTVYGTESWAMYRLPIDPITDGSTYKITMTYKVNNVSEEKPLRLQFTLGQFSNASSMSNDVGYYLEDEFRFTTDTGEEYKTSTFFLTPEFCATVTENGLADDNFTAYANYLYIHFYHDVDDITFSTGRPEAVFSQFDVEKLGEVVVADGVSCLNDDAAAQARSQAMRVYFSYKTTNGTHIEIDGVEYEILERGFVYKNGKASGYTKNKGSEENPDYRYVGGMTKGKGLIESKVNANFHKCWAYDEETNMLTFSNYIKDIPASMESSKLIVRGYVTFQDAEGNVMTVYSDLVNRSVAGIKGTNANITPEEIPVP